MLKERILDISRQNTIGDLSPWFDNELNERSKVSDVSEEGRFLTEGELVEVGKKIVSDLRDYKEQTGVETAVLGMSGGVDSALAAALLKDAGWHVIGVTMPIHQEQSETDRGTAACKALRLEHVHKDLSLANDEFCREIQDVDSGLFYRSTPATKIRAGNVRTRLRMITLYSLASANNGLVVSTDNYSELAAGFWTLHGDVGDLSPIQSLLKSWEVPMLAKLWNVPEEIWRAKPTDGLGVDDGDEAQFGMSYLEMDLMLFAMAKTNSDWVFHDETMAEDGEITLEALAKWIKVDSDPRAREVFDLLSKRIGGTWFKRMNPVNIKHPLDAYRYSDLYGLDELFQPKIVRE